MNNAIKIIALSLLFVAFANVALAQFIFGSKKSESAKSGFDYKAPKEYEIAAIEVTGVNFLDPSTLIGLSGLKVGQRIKVPGQEISDAIKKLWNQGILGDVRIVSQKTEGDYIYLELRLRERPRLSKFTIKGVKKGQADELRKKINLIKGKVVTDALVKNTEIAVKKFYEQKSFGNTKVKISQRPDSTLANSVILDIEVDKGKKIKVKEIIIEGDSAFDEKIIRRKLKDTKQKNFFRVFKSSKFNAEKYTADKENLEQFYNRNGYRDFEIVKDTIYKIDDQYIGIILRIEEGNQYYFRNITWTGNFVYDDKELDRVLAIQRGDVYNKELLDRKLNFNQRGLDVSSLYLDNGYLFFQVDPAEINVENDSIDLEMRIYEGAQATINRVDILGNTKTKDHVIRREIRTLPGDKFSRSLLIRTQQELSQLGYFDPQKIGIQPIPNANDGTVDILYTLEERPADQVELSGGWGGWMGFVGSVGLTFNNFSLRDISNFRTWSPLPSGDGQRLQLRIQANGRQFQTYTFSFTEPWLGGKKPNSFTAAISNSAFRSFNADNTVRSLLSTTSLRFSLGKRLTWPDDYFTLMNGINLQQYNLKNYPLTNSIDFSTGVAYNLNYNFVLSRNSIDNPLFPTQGSTFSLSVTLTPPYSLFRDNLVYKSDADKFKWMEYHKTMFDASYFIGFSPKLTLNTRAHFGFLGAYNKDLGVGPFERFKLGGDGITGFNFILGYDIIGLRGYANNSIVPISTEAGIIFNKIVSELRYSITNSPAASIYVLSFLEAGNNWATYYDYNPFQVYRSFGAGVRIFMPAFGMLGFDYGYGLDELPYNAGANRGQFHFTIGQQIR